MKLTSQRILWYSVIAAIGFILVFAFVYPFIQVGVVPWWNRLLGITETPGPGEAGYIYYGNLQVNIPIYDVYDDSTTTPTGIVCKIWHADETTLFGSATTPDGDDDISGQVLPEDKGILYLGVDHVATVIYYTLDTESATGYVTALSPKDWDDDGMLEHYFKVDVSSFAPLAAGETQREVTLNLFAMQTDVTGLNLVGVANATSADLSGATYLDLYATAYVDGVTLGDGFKMVRVELTMPDSANETYYEDGKVKNVWVQVGEYKWTTLSWQPGQDRFLVWEATDVTQEVYGKPILYDKNMGATDVGEITVHIKGANFVASAFWNPTVKLTFIDPAGTITTDTLSMTFTDT